MQEIEGKNIQDLTKPEWDLIINLYWKDDIDNALAVKDECIRQVKHYDQYFSKPISTPLKHHTIFISIINHKNETFDEYYNNILRFIS